MHNTEQNIKSHLGASFLGARILIPDVYDSRRTWLMISIKVITDDPFGLPLITCMRCHVRTTASETEALALPVREFGTVCHVACEHLTSATNILKHYWRHICLTRPLRFVTLFLYKRLRNTLTYLLTYLLTYMVRKIGARKRSQFMAPVLVPVKLNSLVTDQSVSWALASSLPRGQEEG